MKLVPEPQIWKGTMGDRYVVYKDDYDALRRAAEEAMRNNEEMEMICRKAFYKLSRGMTVSQETMAGLKKYGERNASPLRDAAIDSARKP